MSDAMRNYREALDDSLRAQLEDIEVAAHLANARLDILVHLFDKRDAFAWAYGASGGPPLRQHRGHWGPRSYEEQKRLYERWKVRINPDGIAIPGHSVHSWPTGVAFDLGLPDSDPLWFDNAGRHVSDFNEPWHYEYTPSRKRWWGYRLWRRLYHWRLARVRFDR